MNRETSYIPSVAVRNLSHNYSNYPSVKRTSSSLTVQRVNSAFQRQVNKDPTGYYH